MKIAIIQTDIAWGDVKANLRKMENAIAAHAGADLYLLPEMFSTGFNGDCEREPSEALAKMREIAAERDCAVAGSIALTLSDGRNVNRFYFVTPEGVSHYDKRHLFRYGGEDRRFSGGDERVIVTWRSVRFLLTICYDLRFPVWSRSRGDYDVMLCVASWPTVRRYAWDTLLRARAIENQCFVAADNRVGEDPSCVYDGGSVLLDPWGREIASCPDGKEGVIEGEIKMESLAEFRRTFPAILDADDFSISL